MRIAAMPADGPLPPAEEPWSRPTLSRLLPARLAGSGAVLAAAVFLFFAVGSAAQTACTGQLLTADAIELPVLSRSA